MKHNNHESTKGATKERLGTTMLQLLCFHFVQANLIQEPGSVWMFILEAL